MPPPRGPDSALGKTKVRDRFARGRQSLPSQVCHAYLPKVYICRYCVYADAMLLADYKNSSKSVSF